MPTANTLQGPHQEDAVFQWTSTPDNLQLPRFDQFSMIGLLNWPAFLLRPEYPKHTELITKHRTIIAELERQRNEFEKERDGLKEEFAETERTRKI